MDTHRASNANQHQGGCCCSGKSSVSSRSSDVNNDDNTVLPRHQFRIQGASCSGCVKSIEEEIFTVPGVKKVTVDLSTGVATVVGFVDSGSVIEAITRKGYEAEMISD